MAQILKELSRRPVSRFLKSRFYTFREINRRYAKPRIKQTRLVKVALFVLRVYLLVLVGILIFKFITLARG